jgi:hypothetical protein
MYYFQIKPGGGSMLGVLIPQGVASPYLRGGAGERRRYSSTALRRLVLWERKYNRNMFRICPLKIWITDSRSRRPVAS